VYTHNEREQRNTTRLRGRMMRLALAAVLPMLVRAQTTCMSDTNDDSTVRDGNALSRERNAPKLASS
jgi:hypothetical protein